MNISSLTNMFFGETSWMQWSGDTLIATALLLLIVMLIRKPMARIFGPQLSYLLWLIPLARLFVPVFTQTVEVEAPMAALRDGPLNQIGAAVTGQSANAASIADVTREVAETGLLSIDLLPILLTLWLGGAAIFLIVQLAVYLQQRREILADARELERIDDIRIIEVADIDGPFAFGIFKRFIAVPLDFGTCYTPMEQRLALQHELAHHRARDLWANFAAMFLLSLHWFNPLAWLAYRFFRFDQEAACDARVLAAANDDERAQYSRLIAKAATGRTLALASPLTPHPFAPKNILKERLTLMNQKPKSRTRRVLGSVSMLGGTGAAMALTATVCNAYVVKQPIEEVELAPSEVAAASEPPEAPEVTLVETPNVVVELVDWSEEDSQELREEKEALRREALEMAAEARAHAAELRAESRMIARDRSEAARAQAQQARDMAQAARDRSQRMRDQAQEIRDRAQAIRDRAQAQRDRAQEIRDRQKSSRSKSTTTIRINQGDVRNVTRVALAGVNVDTLVPDISFKQDCSDGQYTARTTSKTINGRTVMMIGVCDKEYLAESRAEAVEGLKEACRDIKDEEDLPKEFRDRLVQTFEKQIERMEANAT
ncbi:MAG: M56 family metallopeptidase [Pseudomonadota bacterium]